MKTTYYHDTEENVFLMLLRDDYVQIKYKDEKLNAYIHPETLTIITLTSLKMYPGEISYTVWNYDPNKCKNNCGYHLTNINRKMYLLHRLVAYTFLGNPPEGKTEVDHIDDNKDNNRPENLRWVTRSENILKAWQTGHHKVHKNINGKYYRCTETLTFPDGRKVHMDIADYLKYRKEHGLRAPNWAKDYNFDF